MGKAFRFFFEIAFSILLMYVVCRFYSYTQDVLIALSLPRSFRFLFPFHVHSNAAPSGQTRVSIRGQISN